MLAPAHQVHFVPPRAHRRQPVPTAGHANPTPPEDEAERQAALDALAILDDQPPVVPAAQDDPRQAHNATLECIHDVLDLAKIEANELELVTEPTQLTAVLRAAYSICEAQARQEAVQLRLDNPSTVPMAWADAKRLRQVVLNRLSHAVKFTGLGVVTLRMRCHCAQGAQQVRAWTGC